MQGPAPSIDAWAQRPATAIRPSLMALYPFTAYKNKQIRLVLIIRQSTVHHVVIGMSFVRVITAVWGCFGLCNISSSRSRGKRERRNWTIISVGFQSEVDY